MTLKQDASATSWRFTWEDLLFVSCWRVNAVNGRSQYASQSYGTGPSVVLTVIWNTSTIQGHRPVTVSHEKMGVGRILLECLKELLFIYTAAQDDCEMCVGVYFMTNTPGYEKCVSSGSQLVGCNSEIGFRFVLFRSVTTLNNDKYYIHVSKNTWSEWQE